ASRGPPSSPARREARLSFSDFVVFVCCEKREARKPLRVGMGCIDHVSTVPTFYYCHAGLWRVRPQ
ncbi:MAG TPA: hypothetical protein PLP42_18925, partial [Acidobacteriota bacterium]|nr:hypothetical protein [Acidobacteriota bacterium]